MTRAGSAPPPAAARAAAGPPNGCGLALAIVGALAVLVLAGMYVLGRGQRSTLEIWDDVPSSVDVAGVTESAAREAFGRAATAGMTCTWTRRTPTEWDCPLSTRAHDVLTVTVWPPRTGSCRVAATLPSMTTRPSSTSEPAVDLWAIQFDAASPRTAPERSAMLAAIAATDPALVVDGACGRS